MLDQNDSIMALSNAPPTEPNEGISPASLTRSVEDPEVNFSAVISMDDAAGLRLALLDRHVESVDDKRGVLDRVDRPADDAPAARVEHAAAGDLPFTRRVLGDVRDPELIGVRARELALDKVV